MLRVTWGWTKLGFMRTARDLSEKPIKRVKTKACGRDTGGLSLGSASALCREKRVKMRLADMIRSTITVARLAADNPQGALARGSVKVPSGHTSAKPRANRIDRGVAPRDYQKGGWRRAGLRPYGAL